MVVVRTDCPLGTYRYQRFETQELQDFGQICTLDLPLVHKFGFSPLPNKEIFGTLGYKPVSRLTTHTDVNAVVVFARSCGSVCNKPPLHVNLPPDQSCRRGQVHVEPAGRSEGGERERGVGTLHTCIHTYMHTCIHAYMHTYIYTCIHASIHIYIHTCMHACIHVYIRVYLHVYAHIHTHKHTHTRTHTHTHTQTLISICIYIHNHTYIHIYIYIHIYKYTYIHTYIHTHTHTHTHI